MWGLQCNVKLWYHLKNLIHDRGKPRWTLIEIVGRGTIQMLKYENPNGSPYLCWWFWNVLYCFTDVCHAHTYASDEAEVNLNTIKKTQVLPHRKHVCFYKDQQVNAVHRNSINSSLGADHHMKPVSLALSWCSTDHWYQTVCHTLMLNPVSHSVDDGRQANEAKRQEHWVRKLCCAEWSNSEQSANTASSDTRVYHKVKQVTDIYARRKKNNAFARFWPFTFVNCEQKVRRSQCRMPVIAVQPQPKRVHKC
jgi:hypothetical protein